MRPLDADISATWSTLVDADPSETIRPERGTQSQPDVVTTLLAHPDGRDELAFGQTIGTGGMGIVRAAEQIRLGRVVAVKSLRAASPDPSATRRLLDEAWVTGTLEHPNIVPIYDIAVDHEHRPHIVMKRITGTQWAEVMDDATAVAERFGALDLLGWNLGILSTVCNAVHFAHTRGIVHRDLKPENVMIGAFGEVYVVDWGIAVAIDGRANDRVPTSQGGRIAGTPRYMAPEMVRGEPGSVAADVYLLGGVLYRVLTGEAPHGGFSVRDILAAVDRFEPAFPKGVPEELAQLVRDATVADPARRPRSAEAFRQRLETFVAHRGSADLAAQAAGHLRALQEELVGARERGRIHGLLGACRFGFQEAIRAWPENPSARTGLAEAVEAVARYEIDERDPRAAALLLAELEAPDPALVSAAERLRVERDADARTLARLSEDLDPRIGQRTRVFILGLFGVSWVIIPTALWLWDSAVPSLTDQIGFALLQCVVVTAFLLWARESMLSTPLNRNVSVLVGMVPASQLVLHGALWLHGADPSLGLPLESLVYAILAGIGVFTVHRALVLGASAYVASTLLCAADPGHGLLWTALANAVLTVILLAVWLPTMPREPTHRQTT